MTEPVVFPSSKIRYRMDHSKYRGSSFRGVSKNGKAWQVLIMLESQKVYLCNTEEPILAAKLYDLTVLQTKGLKAKVNFQYTKSELLSILF